MYRQLTNYDEAKGRVVKAIGFDSGCVLISFTDETWIALDAEDWLADAEWTQDTLFYSSTALVSIGAMSWDERDTLVAQMKEANEKATEEAEYKTYLKLRARFEPGTNHE